MPDIIIDIDGADLMAPLVTRAETAALKSEAFAQGVEPDGPGSKSAKGWRDQAASEAAAQIAAVEEAGDAKIALATEKSDSAAASAANAQAAVASAGNRAWYGSAQFPFENGLTTSARDNGEFRLPGFKTGMTGAGASALWHGAHSIVAIVDHAYEVTDAQNYSPTVFATAAGETLARSLRLSYRTGFHSNAASRRTFRFYISGEAGVAVPWVFVSAQLPDTAKGPYLLFGYNDTTSAYCHVYDIPTATWHYGTAVAKPAGWVGVPIITNDLAIGGDPTYTFPKDNSASFNGATQWRGAIGMILFCNAALTETDVVNIVNGADPVTTATAAGATSYLHIPLTNAVGAISTAVATTGSGMSDGLTQYGNILPGPTMRRQSSATYLTVDRLMWPSFFVRENEATSAPAQITGKYGGLSGTMQVRLVKRDGTIVRDWTSINATLSAGSWTADFAIPTPCIGMIQMQFRLSSDVNYVAATHSRVMVGPRAMPIGQSETVMSVLDGFNSFGSATTLNTQLRGETETVVFAQVGDGSSAPAGLAHMRHSRARPGLLGDSAVIIANALRRRTQEPVMIMVEAVSGTSLIALMRDADTNRKWSDLLLRAGLAQNRGPRGEHIITCDVIGGWEAFYGQLNAQIMQNVYIPWFRGIGSTSGATSGTQIAQEDINHWRFGGELSLNSRIIVMPPNRVTDATTLAAADGGIEAAQRDTFRNFAHIFGCKIGPESITHKMQGENAAGGIPAGSVTHAENAGDYEGTPEMAEAFAEGICMGLGVGRYPGPVFFEAIRAGSANNKVIVSAGNPNPTPGLGMADGAVGYYIDPGDPVALVHATATQTTSIATAVTCNGDSGVVMTVSQTIAAGAEQDFVVNNSRVNLGDVVTCSITAHPSAGTFIASVASVSSGAFTVRLTNLNAASAGNNTLSIGFAVTPSTPRSLVARHRRVAENPAAVKLRTKKTGGDPGSGFEARKNGGAWSKANVTSGVILNGREVELTLAFTYTTGDTIDVRYGSGAPGNYTSGTITQENWRSGMLFYSGDPYVSGSTEKLGWAVAGSNQALTLVA